MSSVRREHSMKMHTTDHFDNGSWNDGLPEILEPFKSFC